MFYGWRVVAGVFIAQLFVVGFFTYAASLLVSPVRAEFGVSLEQIMYSFTLGTFIGLVMMPVAGVMLDRYPARWLIAGGTLALAIGLWLMSRSASSTQFVLAFGATMSVANAFASSMSASTVIARWFTASRGRALGVSALGTSVGGVLLPKMLALGIAELGWRDALGWGAVLVLLVTLPLVVLLVRGKPADVELEPEQDEAGPAAAPPQASLSTADILRMPGFWFMSLSLGLLFSSYSAILANISPYATSIGQGDHAATLIMTVAVTGFIGKLVFGALADRIPLKVGLWSAQLMVLAAFVLLALEPDYIVVFAATVLIGLAAGGMLPVWGALTAQVFGLLSYGRVMGMMGPVITLCVMPGYALVGRVFDATGSYSTAFYVFCGLLILSILLLAPLNAQPPIAQEAERGAA